MSRTSTSIELTDYPPGSQPVTQLPSIHPKQQPFHDDLQPINAGGKTLAPGQQDMPGKGTTAIVLVTVVCVTMISSMLSGVTAVVLPTMARELQLSPSMLLWYFHAAGCIRLRMLMSPGQFLSMLSHVVVLFFCLVPSQTWWDRGLVRLLPAP